MGKVNILYKVNMKMANELLFCIAVPIFQCEHKNNLYRSSGKMILKVLPRYQEMIDWSQLGQSGFTGRTLL